MQDERLRAQGGERVGNNGARSLAAVMFTDMTGYTSLAQHDESLALELLSQHRSILRACLRKHQGKEIKTMGDAFLVEFASALEAVKCALSVQQELYESNITRPLEKRILLRIGVHVGEVVHSKGDIYGDAVNVASRIEPLANPGEILVTQQVYDHVRNKLENPIGYIGKRSLKNVELPVDIYKVVTPTALAIPNASPASLKHRVAVLPFTSISPDNSDEYFADGLTEELISVVSKIGDLRVISRTSSMRYKRSSKTASEIAQELNVGTVLEGSVRKAGDKLRINVELIDVLKDEHLWSQTYDRELKDVFAIQSDIAHRAVEALEVHLLAREEQRIEKRPTENIEAYTLYLKGLHYRGESTQEGFEKAIRYFEEAIRKDQSFALAYAAMADCYDSLGTEGYAPPKESFPKARDSATNALKLDDTIGEAHATLGSVLEEYYLDLPTAEKEFNVALSLNPNYGRVCRSYGAHLACMGRLDEAIVEIRRAQELNPLAQDVNDCAAVIYNCANRHDEAVDTCRRMLELDKNHFPALQDLAEAYLNRSMFNEAIEVLQKALAISKEAPTVKGRLGYAYARSGKRSLARRILQELLDDSKRKYVTPIAIALVYCGLGDNDETLKWLDKAYEERAGGLLSLRVRPMWASLRPDPRFSELLQRLGLEGSNAM